MGKKESVANRQYTDEFKVEAVRLAESIGGNPGRQATGHSGVESVELDQAQPCGQAQARDGAGAVPVKRSVTELEAENARLRRELASAKLDLEIVKKAAAYFAKESR